MALGRIYHRRTAKKGKSMSDKKNTNKYMYQSGGERLTADQYNARLSQITNSFTYSLGARDIDITARTPITFPGDPVNVAVLKSLYNCLASYTVNLKENVPVLTYDDIQTRIQAAITTVKGGNVNLATPATKNEIMGANATTPINKNLKSAADAAAAAAAAAANASP